MAIEKDFRQVDALMSTLRIPPDDVYRSAGEMAIARQRPDVALELLEMSKTNLAEIAKIFYATDQIAAILPWLHSKLKKDSAAMEFAEKMELSNLMIGWFIGCEKPELGSLFR